MTQTPQTDTVLADLESDLGAVGMFLRGGFHPTAEDGLGADVGTVVLVGNAGPDIWSAFSQARLDEDNPMDFWTRTYVDAVAGKHGCRAVYPFGGPPYHPFQRWAMRGDTVFPSPVGILIHPRYGLWHAYRAALLFDGRLDLPAREETVSPCDTCEDKPCLTTCPAGAFRPDGYDVPACTRHLRVRAGRDCMKEGCRARRACPVGREHTYVPAQAAFHMKAFENARP